MTDIDTLDLLRDELLAHFAAVPPDQRELETALPYLSFIRFTQPTVLTRGMLRPSMCLVVQGAKKMLIGKEVTSYGRGAYAVSAIDMPVSGQVVEASEGRPYLGVRIDIDPKELAALILENSLTLPKGPSSRASAYVQESDPDLQHAFLRLVRLLRTPKSLGPLAALTKQEILYRLLTAADGDTFGRSLLAHAGQNGVTEAIEWIKAHYAQRMKIEQLAKAARMSVSTLHHRFKAATVMSPLQYQKQIRLLEARRLLLAGDGDAATVAFQVGYESPSQFSREYRRLFGAPPVKDIASMRNEELVH